MDESQVRDKLREVLYAKLEPVYEQFLQEEGLQDRPIDDQSKVLREIAEETADLDASDLMDNADSLTENNLDEVVRDYVADNEDDDFLITKIEEKFDYDSAKENLAEDLVLVITNTEPYGNISESYWQQKAQNVPTVKELSDYGRNQDVEGFVERYAPDWQEVAQ